MPDSPGESPLLPSMVPSPAAAPFHAIAPSRTEAPFRAIVHSRAGDTFHAVVPDRINAPMRRFVRLLLLARMRCSAAIRFRSRWCVSPGERRFSPDAPFRRAFIPSRSPR
jgi:hypothetical protein